MNLITFIDTEIDPSSLQILDIGGIKDDGSTYHSASLGEFSRFIKGTWFICGHNIFNHDLKYIRHVVDQADVDSKNIIDTLQLSPLLFPTTPYHSLLKDDKLQTDELNNPLNDSIKARDLFYDEVAQFRHLDEVLKVILYSLLGNQKEFQAFFRFVGYNAEAVDVEPLIRQKFAERICEDVGLTKLISEHPVELSYCLVLINANSRYSITPPWVLMNYPEVERIMYKLRNNPCIKGCRYCSNALDIHKGLKRFFGYNSFRKYGDEPLQELAVKAAIDNKSLLAVFPTGGGKSITFQVPALISGESVKGLTVVISPLQSLMKDQVDNLEKLSITEAVTINGMLDPIERAKSLERVENGLASLLYISPESLRSRTIERLLLGRKIVRFVIDEAHCFSAWGQDFRVDYLYIGDFIRLIQEKKNMEETIPVSCFTATAKQKVIEDIQNYFYEKLSIKMELFSSKATRTNLQYRVFQKGDKEEKYQAIRDLITQKDCPVIIYTSRTNSAYKLAERLSKDGFNAKPYHGKMDIKEKMANQNAFTSGEIQIMVATSAFGMGVDKKDVGLVIHYEISDSLENYIQEAGRAGRDENIVADCFILFNEDDLSKHFIMLNQTKLSIKEVQQIWKAIKDITKFRSTVSHSALEIARKAGWDDNVVEIETRVKTAINALEDAGYVKRKQNMPRVYANSILTKNAQEAIDKINTSVLFSEMQKEQAARIIKKLVSSKNKKRAGDDSAESRVDYISDHLGVAREEVINIINLLREEKILADTQDLMAFIKKGGNKNRSLGIVEAFSKIENFLLSAFGELEKNFHIKELNEEAEEKGCDDVTPNRIRTIINFWVIKNWIKRQNLAYSKNHFAVFCLETKEALKKKLEKRHALAKFVVSLLYEKSEATSINDEQNKEEVLVEFSVHELKQAYENSADLFKLNITIEDIEDTLFYLSRIEAIKIEGGFLVLYNRLTIERIEQDNRKKYKVEDYEKLNQYYENKVQQIHIVGEYAKKMIDDYKDSLQFVDDYFRLTYSSFLNKYFKGSRQDEIKRMVTPAKFRQLFGDLSPAQLKIIKDSESKNIVVAAGPGSGKTRVLVHKLASLLLMEDVKTEQLLMLTFSRAAATEFKKRLIALIDNTASFVEIKTFHAYCFDLLGRVGTLEKADSILKETIRKIENKEVEASRITKTVLVIDEAQDMNADEYKLINALMEQNEDMRVIAVGDDDQNIFEFRGANSKYLENFISNNNATKYELVENYRSKSNLVDFTNQFVKTISHRMKQTPIVAMQQDTGSLKLVRYHSDHLISPVVHSVCSSMLTGTTCILTSTNDEAAQIVGLLRTNGTPAKLIQANDKFNLYDLLEIRFFLNELNLEDDVCIISEDSWAHAKRQLVDKFGRSSKLEVCKNLIRDFQEINQKKKYKSDLEIFIRESKIEDFFRGNGNAILVSTIHKSKGKEFDNVFLILDNFFLATEEAKRQLYVAMTRAKQHLAIHVNTNFLDSITTENLERLTDDRTFMAPNRLSMHLTHSDVWLDYFIYKQDLIDQLVSGDRLIVNGQECFTSNGKSVLKFSKSFQEKIESRKAQNFIVTGACVNFVLYWKKEETGQEIKIFLPEVYFEKNSQI
ncbi:RecQ family ATP-dependent DNA helicase [Pinibacter soli]|uniref:DNA 3'-5' helicase n=1 Tax=Pinibacter soli TaxID=3044211 RepID=A0ABT6RDR0_9BACT|nr:RecQ family ATP-dependent DNA helicase [Pinibacter soli]MDI3320611.1 RecQ family ATP-dependent DNA helicase [Pinibacter soli]